MVLLCVEYFVFLLFFFFFYLYKGLVVEENMSNLTSASSEISASSGIRNDNGSLYAHQYSSTSINQEPQPKKKRGLPGHPGHIYKSNHTTILFCLLIDA